jgi:dodecin
MLASITASSQVTGHLSSYHRPCHIPNRGFESEQQDHVTGAVVRITEVVGSSPNSFSDAVRNAVKAAAETVRGIRGVEVVSSNADVDENGNLSLYKVNCKIAFLVERSG